MHEVRPIDANELLECLRIAKKHFEDKGDMLLMFRVDQMLSVLETDGVMPTLDYAPVRHGEWMDIGLGFMMMLTCSNCGKQAIIAQDPYPYCPNCGAKMDGGKNDET